MLKRLLAETLTFPFLFVMLPFFPLMLLLIRTSNATLKKNHEKVINELKKHDILERLLAYTLRENVWFSAHEKKPKENYFWSVSLGPIFRFPQTLLGAYLEFLKRIEHREADPVISVQMDRNGTIEPQGESQLLHFLSHELGHVRNWRRGIGKCSSPKHRTCLKDELLATLAGIKILVELGYRCDFAGIARDWTLLELWTGRCAECIKNPSCRKALEGLLSISQNEDKSHTVNYDTIWNASDGL